MPPKTPQPPPPPAAADYSLIEALHARLRDSSITTSFEKSRLLLRRRRRHRPEDDTNTITSSSTTTATSGSDDAIGCCSLLPNVVRWTLLRLDAAILSSSAAAAAAAGACQGPTTKAPPRRIPNGLPTKNYLDLRMQQNTAFADAQHSLCLRTLSAFASLINDEEEKKGTKQEVVVAREEERKMMTTKKYSMLKELRSHLDKGLAACPDHGGLLQAEKEYQRWITTTMMNRRKRTGDSVALESKVDAAAQQGGSNNAANPTLGGRWIRGAMRDAMAERSFLQVESSSTSFGILIGDDGGGHGQGLRTQEDDELQRTSKDKNDESKEALNPLLLPTPSAGGRNFQRSKEEEHDKEERRYNKDHGPRHHNDNRIDDRQPHHDHLHHNGERHRPRDHNDQSHSLPLEDDELQHRDYREYCRRREQKLEAEYGKQRRHRDDNSRSSRSGLYKSASDDDYENDVEGRHSHPTRSRDRKRHNSHRDSVRSHGFEEGLDEIESKNNDRSSEGPLHHHPTPVQDGDEGTSAVDEKQYDNVDLRRDSQRRVRSLGSLSHDDSDHDHRTRDKRRKSGGGRRHKKRHGQSSRSHDDRGGDSDHSANDDSRKKMKAEKKDQRGERDERKHNKDERRHSRHHRSSSRRSRDVERHTKHKDSSRSHDGTSYNDTDELSEQNERKEVLKDDINALNPLSHSTHVEETGEYTKGEKRRSTEEGHKRRHRSSRHKHHHSGSHRSGEDKHRSRCRQDRSIHVHGDDNNQKAGEETLEIAAKDFSNHGEKKNDEDDHSRTSRDFNHRPRRHSWERSEHGDSNDLSSSSERDDDNHHGEHKKRKRKESERRRGKRHRKEIGGRRSKSHASDVECGSKSDDNDHRGHRKRDKRRHDERRHTSHHRKDYGESRKSHKNDIVCGSRDNYYEGDQEQADRRQT